MKEIRKSACDKFTLIKVSFLMFSETQDKWTGTMSTWHIWLTRYMWKDSLFIYTNFLCCLAQSNKTDEGNIVVLPNKGQP